MTKIELNRKQIDRLNEITQHFHEVNEFIIEVDTSNGIGPAITVRFHAFGDISRNTDTTVNITDVSTW